MSSRKRKRDLWLLREAPPPKTTCTACPSRKRMTRSFASSNAMAGRPRMSSQPRLRIDYGLNEFGDTRRPALNEMAAWAKVHLAWAPPASDDGSAQAGRARLRPPEGPHTGRAGARHIGSSARPRPRHERPGEEHGTTHHNSANSVPRSPLTASPDAVDGGGRAVAITAEVRDRRRRRHQERRSRVSTLPGSHAVGLPVSCRWWRTRDQDDVLGDQADSVISRPGCRCSRGEPRNRRAARPPRQRTEPARMRTDPEALNAPQTQVTGPPQRSVPRSAAFLARRRDSQASDGPPGPQRRASCSRTTAPLERDPGGARPGCARSDCWKFFSSRGCAVVFIRRIRQRTSAGIARPIRYYIPLS